MKEFMMIFHGGDYESGELSPEQFQAKMTLWDKWVGELRENDLFINGHALKNKSAEVKNDDLVLTDRPFVEANEIVTGYFVVKANDLEHARSLTKGYPDFDLGGKVEIREIQTFE